MSLLRLVIVSLLLFLLPVQAESKFSLANTPGKLPKDILPEHYAITLTPDLATQTFTGTETVTIRVTKPRNTIILNSLEMTISAAEVAGQTALIQSDADQQTTTFTLPTPLPVGTHRLSLKFQGKINNQSQGLYADKYATPQGQKVMLATQMEPTDARRMFPGWDEPVFRATYQLMVIVPVSFLAVSNTPVAQEQPLGDGRKRVIFRQTPKMPSYLMALIAGELETLTGEAAGVQIRIITTAGKKERGRYALETAQKLLVYYNDYFGVPYPLPKLDMIAIPGGFSGAMENWGAITYNEAILLFDPKSSSQETREDIFAVVAHEIAHQWFGNLVTMAWWDNLWLNEGFASWMGTKATDHFNPSWNVWLRESTAKNYVMTSDSRKSTHPIQQPVRTESEANEAFDEITYLKGQAFIKMLESYLGENDFRAGIRLYMGRHPYSNTTTADLWAALSEASGKPVQNVAAGWTEQPGFPLVSVKTACTKDKQVLTLAQERFTVNDPTARPLSWQIPVTYAHPRLKIAPQTILLTGKTSTVPTVFPCGQPLKLNYGNGGYYRVKYTPALTEVMQLSPTDRVNLLGDSWALVEAGRAPATTYLDLVEQAKTSTEVAAWEQIVGTLGTLAQLERGRPGQATLYAYGRGLLRPVLAQVGWDSRPGEPQNTVVLRNLVIRYLGSFNDPATITEARQRFQAFLRDPAALQPDLREVVIATVGRHSDRATYDQLRTLGRQATSTEEKFRYYNALQLARDPALARETLSISLTDELPPARATRIVSGVAGVHPELAWAFVQQNLQPLLAKRTSFQKSGYVPGIAANFSDPARATELETFAKTNLPAADQKEVQEATETIRFQANLKARELPNVDRWLTQKTSTKAQSFKQETLSSE
ncbi:M1 family metallopeptidase [Candidatus Cyanaurora vandensis]|uniref:M1 family metallopeptidase n=1 Tax=Candidatus Cyanaurora vandensis TaxID=2714958 RepID=UPI002580FE87|nr:M1 family metallopeptidase [Candidatus Cyanaurora vandensis]